MPGRTTLTHTSFCRELIVLPGTCVELLTPASPLSLIYRLYVLFVWNSYQARFGLKISYPAIVFTMVIGLLNCGSFIVHILLLGTSKVFTLSVFLPCACVHVLLPGTQRIVHDATDSWIFFSSRNCYFVSWKIPKIPENSWILGEVEAQHCSKLVTFRAYHPLCFNINHIVFKATFPV